MMQNPDFNVNKSIQKQYNLGSVHITVWESAWVFLKLSSIFYSNPQTILAINDNRTLMDPISVSGVHG